jgi:hypothetical protein
MTAEAERPAAGGTTPRPAATDVARPAYRLHGLLFTLALAKREVVLPVAVIAAAALVLIPTSRAFAWLALLAISTAVGWRVGRSPGIVAAATAALAYMFVHGQPRFASTITDELTIRASFILGILGAAGAAVADRRYGNATKRHG